MQTTTEKYWIHLKSILFCFVLKWDAERNFSATKYPHNKEMNPVIFHTHKRTAHTQNWKDKVCTYFVLFNFYFLVKLRKTVFFIEPNIFEVFSLYFYNAKRGIRHTEASALDKKNYKVHDINSHGLMSNNKAHRIYLLSVYPIVRALCVVALYLLRWWKWALDNGDV